MTSPPSHPPRRPAKKARHVDSTKLTSTLLMLLATALLLPLIFPPFYLFFLAPFALVPFALCVLRRRMSFWYLMLYYALGVAFYFPNLFWLWPVALFGVMALSVYLAIYFPLFAWVFHRLVVQFRLPATVALPLAWTSIEFIRATFLQGGFPWFILGNCLTPVPLLLQTADLFGVWTLTFLITMAAGFLVDLLRLPLYPRRSNGAEGKFNPTLIKLGILTGTTLVLAVGYGVFRLVQYPFTPGPRVAVIQENLPQSLKDDPKFADANFQKHVQLSRVAASATPTPDLIVWPETMVPRELNPEILHINDGLLTDDGLKMVQDSRHYDAMLTSLATATNIPLLIGAPGTIPSLAQAGRDIHLNLTLLYLPITGQSETTYAKIHLVPFGEYIAFLDVPLLGSVVRYFTPPEMTDSLTPGTKWTRFTLKTQDSRAGTFTFATPICFEDTMPTPARLMTLSPDGRKTDFLLNVSNDGWFFSTELDQHLQACQLRAVENRIPIARSVNTGDSGFIDSDGRIVQLVTNPQTNSSIGAIGTAAQTLLIDSRVSLYSRIGDLLPIVTTAITALLLAYTYVRPRRNA